MRYVALLLVGIRLAFAGTHSMFHFYTAVTGDPYILKVTGVAKIDDQQVTYFDSITMKSVPKTEWFKQCKDDDFWKSNKTHVFYTYNEYKEKYIPFLMALFNHSMSDVHTLQLMTGCELEDDGTNRGYLQIGYDGEDLDSFDMEKLNWNSSLNFAAKVKMLHVDFEHPEILKRRMDEKCIEFLKECLSHVNDSMERKAPPLVSLLQKNSSSPVICHATGYPKDITMTWMKNHEELHEDVEVSSTLPNEDGSFQKSISLSVNPEEWKKNPDVYRCVIQSVGNWKEIVVLLNENNIKSNSDSSSIIVKCLVFITIAIVVGCVVALAVFAAKKRRVCSKTTQVRSPDSAGYVKGSSCIEMTDEPIQNEK